MAGRLQGKVALITGAARGQGAAEARLFASEGATVVLADVLDEQGELTAREIGAAAAYVHLDVTDAAQWEAVVKGVTEDHGRIDVLVNNAGIFRVTPLLDPDRAATFATYRQIVAINQDGVYLGMLFVAPVMVANKAGSIINISSIAGLTGSPGFTAYGATKWALRGISRGAAKELAPFGVRVNTVHPGIIATDMLATFDALGEGVRDAVRERIPLGREATADEVAKVVLFLASDEAGYCTGGEFTVDGAYSA